MTLYSFYSLAHCLEIFEIPSTSTGPWVAPEKEKGNILPTIPMWLSPLSVLGIS